MTQYNSNWMEFIFPLNNQIITKDLIKISLQSFWNQTVKIEIAEDKVFVIQFKVKLGNGVFRSISTVQKVDSKDLELLTEIFISFWEIKSDEYQLAESLEIIFNYNLLKYEKLSKKVYKPNLLKTDEKTLFNFKGYNLPNTMDLTLWGDYIFKNDFSSAIVYKPHSKVIYHISLFENCSCD